MEATVTITLREIESMKSEIRVLKKEISDLKSQKDFRVSIDGDLYNWKDGNRVFTSRILTFGHLEEVTDKSYKEVKIEMETLFNKLIDNSSYLRFYQKFPKWVHKLFKC